MGGARASALKPEAITAAAVALGLLLPFTPIVAQTKSYT
jgi:hypothetical protein